MKDFVVPVLIILLVASSFPMISGPSQIALGSSKPASSQASPATSGTLGMVSWQLGPSLAKARNSPRVVAADGYLFAVGGDTEFGSTNTVERAQILPGGGLGPWLPTASPPSLANALSIISHGNYVYYVGGDPSPASSLLGGYARVLNGDIQEWKSLGTPSGHAGWAPSIVAANGFLFMFYTGAAVSGKAYLAGALRAPINSDGSPGPWVDLGSLGVAAGGAVTNGDWIYLFDDYYVSGFIVYRASVSKDGALGSFTQSYRSPYIGWPSATIQRQALYVLGSECTPAWSCTAFVNRFSIQNEGGLLNLGALPPPANLYGGGVLASAGDTLYIVGGYTDTSRVATSNTRSLWLAPYTTALPLIRKGDVTGGLAEK